MRLTSPETARAIYDYADIPARVAAVGSYVPAAVRRNAEIPGLARSDAAVRRLLGAVERHVAPAGTACSDLIVQAGRRVLEKADVEVDALDRIIVSATPGDYLEPSTAAIVQGKLGATCAAHDVGMSCVGWLAGMDLALRCIATGDRRVLVLAGTVIPPDLVIDPMHHAIFGDGAGGSLVERTEEPGSFVAGNLYTWGQFHTLISLPHHLSPRRPDDGGAEGFFMGDTAAIRDRLDELLASSVDQVVTASGHRIEDFDHVFLHQANQPLFERGVKALGLRRDQVIADYARYGNTVSAELPISLSDATESGRISRGDLVLLVTFGAGLSGGAMILRY